MNQSNLRSTHVALQPHHSIKFNQRSALRTFKSDNFNQYDSFLNLKGLGTQQFQYTNRQCCQWQRINELIFIRIQTNSTSTYEDLISSNSPSVTPATKISTQLTMSQWASIETSSNSIHLYRYRSRPRTNALTQSPTGDSSIQVSCPKMFEKISSSFLFVSCMLPHLEREFNVIIREANYSIESLDRGCNERISKLRPLHLFICLFTGHFWHENKYVCEVTIILLRLSIFRLHRRCANVIQYIRFSVFIRKLHTIPSPNSRKSCQYMTDESPNITHR